MKRCIFIGQAMPRFKKDLHDWPSLNSWLYSINLTDEQIKTNFFYSALVDYFPGSHKGGHLVPTHEEISKEKDQLKKTLNTFDPEIVVTVGKLSLRYCLGQKIDSLKNYIGKTFNINPYGLMTKEVLVIPLPHPSGASIWYKNKDNKFLLDAALKMLLLNL